MPKQDLKSRVNRLIAKCEKQGYEFNELELGMFNAMGRVEWDEEKVNWLVLQQFERLYARLYPAKIKDNEDTARKKVIEHAEKHGRWIDIWEAKNVE
jgi:hypothetical protein